MESSDDRDREPGATNSSGASDDAQFDQAASATDWVAAGEPASSPHEAHESVAEASDPWYPVVGATEPVLSAVEPVPGSASPVSTETPSVPVVSPEPPTSAAEGPVWPDVPVAAEAASSVSPASDVSDPADTPAASSGAWPEPPTPWADTGAMAAIGAAVGATDTPATPPTETPALEGATPDVSDLPTAVYAPEIETPQLDTPQVDDAPPPVPEAPPAYTPPPNDYPPPSPPAYAAPPQSVASAYVASPARPRDTTPVLVEAILAFFGLYGIGWLIAGETTIGVSLLIAGFVWDAIFVVAAFTVIGLCCVVPLQLIFVALSAFQLNNRLRMRG